MNRKKAVFRVSDFVNNSEFAPACASRQAKAVAWAALLSPAGVSPTGADEVFVPSNGVITLNLDQIPTEKKTEGLQYQEALFRTSCRKKAVFRDSCKTVGRGLRLLYQRTPTGR